MDDLKSERNLESSAPSASSAPSPFISIKRLASFIGLFTVIASLAACNPNSTQIGTDFYAGVFVSTENSYTTVSAPTVVSGSSVTLTLHLKDKNYKPFVSTLPRVSFRAMGGGSAGLIGAVTNNRDGTYQASFTGLATGSPTTIHATVDGIEVASTLPTVSVTSGNFSLSNSLLTLSAASVLITNTVTATLTTYDSANNPLTAGGLSIVFSNSGGTSAGTWGATIDAGNGTYTAVFTSTTSGSATTVSASISGSAITSALPTLTVTGVASSVPASLAAASTPGSVALTWAASTGTAPITYAVKRATVAGGPYTTLQSGVAVTNYTDATAANGTTYYYVVSSTNAVGTSANSSEVSARPISAFTISGVSVNGAGALQISWGAATGASAYTLRYGTATGVYGTTVSTSATSPTTVSSLTAGTTYYFMVVATNAVGAGTNINATTESTGVPMAAFTITAATRASTSSSITWTASTGSTSYTLKYGTATGVYGTTFSTAATSATNVTGLAAGTPYYFRVTAVNASGSLDSTAELSQTTLAPFTQTWPFDALSDANYSFDTSKIDFTGGVCRLTGTDQVDDANDSAGFAGGTLVGAAWDGTNGIVRLSNTGGCNGTVSACANQTAPAIYELSPSWTPQWSTLVGYWKLNESIGATSAPDYSPAGTNSGTIAAGVTMGLTGKIGKHASLNGALDACINAGNSASLQISTGTMSAWVNASSPGSTYRTILAKQGAYGLFLKAGVLMTYNWNTFADFSTNRNIDDGTWHHVVMVFRNGTSNGTQIYLDGALVGTTTYTIGNQLNFLGIGCNSGTTQELNGSIDEVAVWSSALTASEIETLYTHQNTRRSGTITSRVMDALATGMNWTTLSWIPTLPFLKELPDYASGAIQNETSADYPSLVGASGTVGDNNLMSGIVGLWHFNESAGTVAANSVIDDSGLGNNGTPNAVTFSNQAKFGNAASFAGGANYVSLGNPAFLNNLPSADFTFSAWVKDSQTATGTFGTLLGSYDSGIGWNIRTSDNGDGLRFIYFDAPFNGTSDFGNWMYTKSASGTIRTNQWHHVVAVYKVATKSGRIFIDGVETAYQEQSSGVGPYLADAANPKWIGRLPHAGGIQSFNGSLDEVAIWSRALDPIEIRQLYRRGANRLKYQVRICTTANAGLSECTDDPVGANWKGPDGTNQTYFSELNNNTVPLAMTGTVKKSLPSMLFSAFTNPVGTSRYFQYRAIFESDDTGTGCNYGSGATWCSPELKSVAVDPVHYDSASPTVIGKTGVSYYSLATFAETIQASACPSGVGYNLGKGAAHSSATWYWWDSTKSAGCIAPGTGAWCGSDGTVAQSNDAATISTRAPTFGTQVGTGTVYFKPFLRSSGTSKCELDKIDLAGQQ